MPLLALLIWPTCTCMQAERWGPCGGASVTGFNASDPDACCPSGTSSNYYHEYFWQCQPDGYVPRPKPIGTWDDSCTGARVRCLAGCRMQWLARLHAEAVCWWLLPWLHPPST